MHVQSYLFFDGRCEEALEFYRTALDAKIETLIRYKDSPERGDPSKTPPDRDEKILHAGLRIGETLVMASDGHCKGNPTFQGFALTIHVKDDAEVDRLLGVLSKNGQVQQQPIKTFFSSRFAVVTDRFGVLWMLLVGK